MKKLIAVGASVVLLWLWLQRKYKTAVEQGQRRQGRSVPRSADAERPHRVSEGEPRT